MNDENECLFIYTFDYMSVFDYSWCSCKAHNLFLHLNVLIYSVFPLCVALVSEVGGISEETAACDWWSLGAILFELLTGMVSHKVPKNKLSLLLRCYRMSVGVLALNSLELFMAVPACVLFCVCVGRWRLLFALCLCVCEVRLGCCLVLWFSGNARGVGVTFSPSLSSICWAMGSALPGHLCWLLEQHCALSTLIWGQRGRWRPGQLSRCRYPAGLGSGLSEGWTFKIDLGGKDPFFIYLFIHF